LGHPLHHSSGRLVQSPMGNDSSGYHRHHKANLWIPVGIAGAKSSASVEHRCLRRSPKFTLGRPVVNEKKQKQKLSNALTA